MRLQAFYFGNGIHERLARLLRATAECHCPDWEINVQKVSVRRVRAHYAAAPAHKDNAVKTQLWNDAVQAAADGERLLLMDADMFVCRSMTPGWDLIGDADLGYTVKHGSSFPFNAGVIFVNVSTASRLFFHRWNDATQHLLLHYNDHQKWRRKYGGLAQAAMGMLIDDGPGVTLQEMDCREWNCEDSNWTRFDPEITRAVHVKGRWRNHIIHRWPPNADFRAVDQYYRGICRDHAI